MQHPEAPVRPIIRLARRLLSICANAASCERLFSSLGNILTKLRNRLGNKTLLSLAEMKMLIRDEHLRSQDLQRRLKFQLEGDRRQTAQVTENAGLPPESIPPQEQQPSPSPEIASESDQSPENADEEEISSEELTQELLYMAEEEESSPSAADLANEYAALFPQRLTIKIADLFDFQVSYWSDACEQAGEAGLGNELELCELLDSGLSSDGSSQIHTDLDAGVESIVFS